MYSTFQEFNYSKIDNSEQHCETHCITNKLTGRDRLITEKIGRDDVTHDAKMRKKPPTIIVFADP